MVAAVCTTRIGVWGEYHEFGKFVSDVASLPRIVTLHDFTISPVKNTETKQESLMMQATAKTYRYLDEEEIEANEKAKEGKGK